MSAPSYLAFWVSLDHTHRPGSEGLARSRPEVRRQRTWAEGRWNAFFQQQPAGPAVSLPAQRVPLHDVVESDSPALVQPSSPVVARTTREPVGWGPAPSNLS